jgi:hypothetical protein
MAAPLTLAGYANQLAGLLGLNKWDLFQATYNRCSFMTMAPPLPATSNPLAGIINLANSSAFGAIPGTDPNGSLFATTMNLMQAKDGIKRKVVRHSIPNSNVDIIDDFGWSGLTIKMNAIFTGSQYLNAISNFLQYTINEQANRAAIGSANYHVLIHPVWGRLEDVLLADVSMLHESKVYKGAVLELTFECTNSNYNKFAIKNKATIGQYFDALQIAIAGLAQTVALTRLVAL